MGQRIKELRGRAAKRATARGGRAAATRDFLRSTFYYLKSEQFLKVSRRLLCEAA